MSRADSVIKKLSNALNKVGPMSRTSYKRVITQAAGFDDLTGRGGSPTVADTKFTPQPVFKQLGTRKAELMSGTKIFNADDYHFLFTPDAATSSDFQATNVEIVLKDSSNNVERLRVFYTDPVMFGGKEVALNVYARSVDR